MIRSSRLIWLSCIALCLQVPGRFTQAVILEFDYSHDKDGYFDAPERRAVIEAAGAHVNRFVDSLEGIHPDSENKWVTVPPIPPTGSDGFLFDMVIPQDTLKIIIGGNSILPELTLATTTAKEAGFLSGTPEFERTVTTRGQEGALASPPTDFGPWGATIMFNSDPENVSWHFGLDTEGLEPHETDFMTVLMHELMHVFGFGGAASFQEHIDNLHFTGPAAQAVGSSNNSSLAMHDDGHWKIGTLSTVGGLPQEASLGPIISPGQRLYPTPLDRAALVDAGWEPARTGDANLDRQFDANDLVVTLQGAKYRTGEVASWRDGDWTDDLFFDQNDLIDALGTGLYLSGPYAATQGHGDRDASANDLDVTSDSDVELRYDTRSGTISVSATSGASFSAILLESKSESFSDLTSDQLDGVFDYSEAGSVFKATFGSSFDSVAFYGIAPTDLEGEFLLDDLSVAGAFDGGGKFGDFDLVIVPEPTALGLALCGVFLVLYRLAAGRRKHVRI